MRNIIYTAILTCSLLILSGCSKKEEQFTFDPSSLEYVAPTEGFITGVQHIMIGTRCNNYNNALETLKRIKEAGYEGIEINEFMAEKSSIMIRLLTKFSGMPIGKGGKLDWHSLVNESGLKVTSYHSYLNSIEEDPGSVAQKAKSFGTDIVVMTGMYNTDIVKEAPELVKRLNAAGKALKDNGITFLYHNHNMEFQKMPSGQTVMDYIIENTDPEYVNFEVDSFWADDAGIDVVGFFRKLGSRMVLWHINDKGCRKEGTYFTPILKEKAMELGYGNMPLDTLSSIAIENGVKGVILETHMNWIDDDPVKSIEASSAFMQKIKAKSLKKAEEQKENN